jgi:acyl-CoA reductase-like NAD-dependent aldehyde dehydrogenase
VRRLPLEGLNTSPTRLPLTEGSRYTLSHAERCGVHGRRRPSSSRMRGRTHGRSPAALVAEVADAFRAVRVGMWNQRADMGPLINARQEKRVLDFLVDRPGRGRRSGRGGGKLIGELYDSGYFVEAALFDRVTPGMRIAQEEIFGSVLSVLAYEDKEEAVAVANGTRYGLTATVWTREHRRRDRSPGRGPRDGRQAPRR